MPGERLRRLPHDDAGVERAGGIEAVLEFGKHNGKFGKQPTKQGCPREAQPLLTADCAAERRHMARKLLGKILQPSPLFGIMHVDKGPDVQLAMAGVPKKHGRHRRLLHGRLKTAEKLRQQFGGHDHVFDEGHRRCRALHAVQCGNHIPREPPGQPRVVVVFRTMHSDVEPGSGLKPVDGDPQLPAGLSPCVGCKLNQQTGVGPPRNDQVEGDLAGAGEGEMAAIEEVAAARAIGEQLRNCGGGLLK